MTYTNIIRLQNYKELDFQSKPAVLTIAGSDSSGGAGIEADLKTLNAHKVYGLTCITCLTAQNTQLIKTTANTSENMIRDILKVNFDDFLIGYDDAPLKAIKTGMLTMEAIVALNDYLPTLKENNVKLIVDPVMFSTSGFKLFDEAGLNLCIETLFKHSYLITPNFKEAIVLQKIAQGDDYKEPSIKTLVDYSNFVKSLQQSLGCRNILVKGGHIPWNSESNCPASKIDAQLPATSIIDILYESESDLLTIFDSQYLQTGETHGTGCTLSSAIAANIANSLSLREAVPLSINFVQRGIFRQGQKLGHGNGPLNHSILPEEKMKNVIISKDSNISSEIASGWSSFLDFFKNHPKIKKNWEAYTNHKFIKLLAEDRLPFKKFLYFLKQDYYYLKGYAQIHGYSAFVAPTYHQTHLEALIISNVVREIENHKEKLCKKYNIDYERDIDVDIELNPGKACLEYCDYLQQLAKTEDFLGIKVALAPCLHGYAEAGAIGQAIRTSRKSLQESLNSSEESEIYQSWLNDYTSIWYLDAYNNGKAALQELLKVSHITQERIEELVEIFNNVTMLEVKFWDEVLKITD